MKKEITQVSMVALICGTIFASSFNLQSTGSVGASMTELQNSISVSGEGTVTATPDIVRIRAGISETRQTTKAAQEASNQKIQKILTILQKYNIPENDIQTANLSYDQEYDWSDSKRKIIGQRVRQNLNVKISDILKTPEQVTQILDELGTIDGLELDSVVFDIEDKKKFFTQARSDAFAKAEQKANELAKLGNLKLLKPIHISEVKHSYSSPLYSNFARSEMSLDSGGGSSLPTGELEIKAELEIFYGIE